MSDQTTANLFPAGRSPVGGGPLTVTPPPQAPTRVGDYQLLREVGRGGMGVVYEAYDPRLRRRAAVKMPHPHLSGDALPRFQTEAEAMAQLAHPHIIAIHDIGWHDGRPFVACEFLPGGTLLARTENKPQPPRAAAELVRTLAGAVAHAHANGVVHRDLKPANVLFDAAGQPKLTDFGAARLAAELADPGAALTKVGQVIGTPQYMAPEQARGGPDGGEPGVDVYALGAVLYHLLTGRPPHDGPDPFDILSSVVRDEPVAPRRLSPAVPRDLETVCLKALDKHPARRYPSADALAADLDRFLNGEPVRARPTGVFRRTVIKARRRPLVAGLLASLVLVAAAGAGGVGWQWRRAVAARDAAEANAAATTDALGAAETARADALAAAGAAETARGDAQAAADRERKALRDSETALDRAERKAYALQVTMAARHVEAGESDLARAYMSNVVHTARQAVARGWEWGHLRQLATPYLWRVALDTPTQQGFWPQVMAASPDGTRVAVAAGDPYADNHHWDANQPCHLFVPAAGVGLPFKVAQRVLPERAEQVVWVDADRVAVCGRSGGVAVVNLADPKKSLAWPAPPAFCRPDPPLARLSPDGRWAVRGSGRGELTVIDLRAGRVAATLPPLAAGPATALDISAGGLAAVRVGRLSVGGDLLLVELPGGRVRGRIRWVGERAAFSADGRRVAAHHGRHGRRGLGVWDTADGAVVWEQPQAESGSVTALLFSPDGRSLAEARTDWPRVRVWDAAAGRVRFDLAGHTSRVLFAAAGPDGRHLLTAGNDGSVRTWSLADGAELAARRGHANGIRTLTVAPAGDRLYTGGMDGTMAGWDLTRERPDGGRLPPLDPADPAPADVPDDHGSAHVGGLWAASDGTAWVLDTGRRRLTAFDPATFTPVRAVTPAGLRPRGDTLAADFALAADGSRLVGPLAPAPTRPAVWATADGAEVGRPPDLPPMTVTGAALSADGRRAAVVGYAHGSKPVVAVWEPDTGRVLHQQVGGPTEYRSAAFLPDGRLALGVYVRGDRTTPGGLDLLDTASGDLRRLGVPRPTALVFLAVSADGRQAAAICNRRRDLDGLSVYRWDLTAGTLAWQNEDVGPVVGLGFSPAGDRLAAVRYDDRLTLWRADTGEPAFHKSVATGRLGDYAYPARAVFTPGGRRLITNQADGRLSVWVAEPDGATSSATRAAAGHAEAAAAVFGFHLRAAAELAVDPTGVGFRLHAARLDRLAPPNPHAAATWAGLKQRAGLPLAAAVGGVARR